MIVKLSKDFALFTNWTQDRALFKANTIREATPLHAEEALLAIPRDQISSDPDGFRTLALAVLGPTWVGEFSEQSLQTLKA